MKILVCFRRKLNAKMFLTVLNPAVCFLWAAVCDQIRSSGYLHVFWETRTTAIRMNQTRLQCHSLLVSVLNRAGFLPVKSVCNNAFMEDSFRHLCTHLPGFWKSASLANSRNKRTVLKIPSLGQSYCHHTAGLDSSKIRQTTLSSSLHVLECLICLMVRIKHFGI